MPPVQLLGQLKQQHWHTSASAPVSCTSLAQGCAEGVPEVIALWEERGQYIAFGPHQSPSPGWTGPIQAYLKIYQFRLTPGQSIPLPHAEPLLPPNFVWIQHRLGFRPQIHSQLFFTIKNNFILENVSLLYCIAHLSKYSLFHMYNPA